MYILYALFHGLLNYFYDKNKQIHYFGPKQFFLCGGLERLRLKKKLLFFHGF